MTRSRSGADPRAPTEGAPAANHSRRASVQALLAAAAAHHRRGDPARAEALYREVLARAPGQPDALHLLAVLLGSAGRSAEAESLFREALRRRPASAVVLSNFGNFLRRLGRLEEAAEAYEKALALEPENVDALANYAGLRVQTGECAEAEELARRALALNPGHVVARANLAGSLAQRRCIDEADGILQTLTSIPETIAADVALTRGHVALVRGRTEEAVACYRRVLAARPDDLEAMRGLGAALTVSGAVEEAEPLLTEVVRRRSDPCEATTVLGHVYVVTTRLDEGLKLLERSVARPGAGPDEFSTYLFELNYHPEIPATELFRRHLEWEKRFGNRVPRRPQERFGRGGGRRRRVGFVSPDLRAHSVSFFLRPLLRHLDRDRFETFCYSDVRRPDGVTADIRERCHHWREIWRRPDSEVAEKVLEDGIDILVDLAGHTSNNRLPLFARRLAPIQVTYLGYPNTTGLGTMDARLVDAITDPIGFDRLCVERLVRLDSCFLAYEPTVYPPVAPPPCRRHGRISFGCFNNVAKINRQVAQVWARILEAVPGSRLVLKHDNTRVAVVRRRITAWFEQAGITADRLVFLERSHDLVTHLSTYADIDIALDPWPYNGTTTTCEALWMGVPVVTLTGDRHAARVGTSLLTAVGFTAGIARDADDYVLTAVQLASLPDLLKHLRYRLRHEIVASPLFDGARLARSFGDAMEELWREWSVTGHTARGVDHEAPEVPA